MKLNYAKICFKLILQTSRGPATSHRKAKWLYQRWFSIPNLNWCYRQWENFSMAHIIQELQMPTLIMTHNKTLAAQLSSEFKGLFPKNRVEYFISHFDY